jgi:hypothetical protein
MEGVVQQLFQARRLLSKLKAAQYYLSFHAA